MNRRFQTTCTLLALAMLAAGSALGADVEFEIFRPVTPEEADVPLLSPDTPGAAGELGPAARCSETVRRSAEIELRWQPGAAAAGVQRVDVTRFRDGFALGRYEVSPLLAPGRDSVGLAGPEPGINYYWRVLTETPQGWAPSRVERFEVPVCPWDPPNPDLLGADGPAGEAPGDESAEEKAGEKGGAE